MAERPAETADGAGVRVAAHRHGSAARRRIRCGAGEEIIDGRCGAGEKIIDGRFGLPWIGLRREAGC